MARGTLEVELTCWGHFMNTLPGNLCKKSEKQASNQTSKKKKKTQKPPQTIHEI